MLSVRASPDFSNWLALRSVALRLVAPRGTRVVEDTRTGTRSDVNLGYSGEIVRRLNQREGYERYREIPLRDLNQ